LLQIRSTSGLKADISADMPWERSIGKASASKLKIYAKKDGRYQMSWYEQAGKRHVATRGTLAAAKSFQTQKIAELQRHRETKFDSEDRQMYSEVRELALDHGCTVLQANSAGRGMSDLVIIGKQTLTAAQYSDLADVPPELEWLANITNGKTRRFYKSDVEEFLIFTGLRAPAELRTVYRGIRGSRLYKTQMPIKETRSFVVHNIYILCSLLDTALSFSWLAQPEWTSQEHGIMF
jgi:hypothetical protein